MDIRNIFKKSVDTLKNNFIIVVPPMTVSLIITLFTLILAKSGLIPVPVTGGKVGPSATGTPDQMMGMSFIIIGILSMILLTLSHGVVVAMAREAIDRGRTTFISGFKTAKDKIGNLFLASVLLSVIVMGAASLFIIPGLIAIFFLMFTVVGIILGNLTALDAMKNSFNLVKSNLKDSAVIFIALVVLGFFFGFVSLILSRTPIVGQLISLGLTGTFWGYTSIVIVRAYDEMIKPSTPISA